MPHSLQRAPERSSGLAERFERDVRLQRALVLSLAAQCERLAGAERDTIAGQLVEELRRLESLVGRKR